MNTPHYVLFAEAQRCAAEGQWRFVLQSVDGSEKFEAADVERETSAERLELLTVVRGLEAIDRPARVTLVTHSRYVNRGLEYGLREWRSNGWTWEKFGHMVPVKNRDLWRRVDQALRYHDVECRRWRFDGPHSVRRPTHAATTSAQVVPTSEVPARSRRWLRRLALRVERWLLEAVEACRLRLAQLGTGLVKNPWLG